MDREFQDFLYGKALKVTYFGTPMHTSVRILKKSDEIDFATFDLENEMRKLQTIRAFMHAIENEDPEKPRHFPGNLFSPIYRGRYQDRAHILDNYYELQAKPVHFWDSGETRQFSVLRPKAYCLETVKCLLKIHLEDKEDMPHIDEAIPYFDSLYSVFNSPVKKSEQVKFALEIIQEKSYGYRATILFLANALANKDFNFQGYKKDAIKRYLKFTQQHIHFMAQMTDANFSLDKQMKILKTGMWLQKNHMRYVIGRFENMDNDQFKEGVEQWSDKNYRTEEKARHKIYMNELKLENTPALFDETVEVLSKENGIEITEIASKYDLFWEGEELRHCVGGYWDSIMSGDSMIFSLKSEEEDKLCRSTLEIHPNKSLFSNKEKTASSIRQHRSFGNTKPTKKHEELGFKILEATDNAIKKAAAASLEDVVAPLEIACKVKFIREKLKEQDWREDVIRWEDTGFF